MKLGVCTDQLNPYGRLRPDQLRSLGNVDFVRAEIRDAPARYSQTVDTLLLYGPSTEHFYIPRTHVLGVIIGNEPDYVPMPLATARTRKLYNRNSRLLTDQGQTGPVSSWWMSVDEYVDLYNMVAAWVPDGIYIIAAGMVGGPEYLEQAWPRLDRKPDIVTKHYPNNLQEVVDFKQAFDRPVLIGETCYYTAQSMAELRQWFYDLAEIDTWGASWFCKDNAMVTDMGLYDYNHLTQVGKWFKGMQVNIQ